MAIVCGVPNFRIFTVVISRKISKFEQAVILSTMIFSLAKNGKCTSTVSNIYAKIKLIAQKLWEILVIHSSDAKDKQTDRQRGVKYKVHGPSSRGIK